MQSAKYKVQNAGGGRSTARLRDTLELIKFSHTIFALPFALGAMWVAAHGWPGWRTGALIIAAMITARATAMAVNRLADRHFDARNPRTRDRPLPAGRLSPRYVITFTVIMLLGFLLCTAALNRLALQLAPVALLVLCGYSFMKRVTPWSHLVLGASLGLAAPAAEVAVRAAISAPFVLLGLAICGWVAGFDIIYATLDVDFDRAHGLHSVPARFGVATALWIARGLHIAAAVGFFAFGRLAQLGTPYFIATTLMALALLIEQSLVRAHDLSRVNTTFFTANGWVSMLFFCGTLGGTR
ncbi:MAG: 4-hydroxybenzoate octaprenyltransferase [Deltaproteobacteria bacterium]|nr:4-hydroxybenzoate octaprenyltransferase [Deltaproteobacteria bacterium]